jgi:hypothetical protein
MQHNEALNGVPTLRAQSAKLARAYSEARKCGSKQRADKSSANPEPKASLLDELDEVNRSEAELNAVNVPEPSI